MLILSYYVKFTASPDFFSYALSPFCSMISSRTPHYIKLLGLHMLLLPVTFLVLDDLDRFEEGCQNIVHVSPVKLV
jgi:hypothetical protein